MPYDGATGPPHSGPGDGPGQWAIVAWVPVWSALDVLSRSVRTVYAASMADAVLIGSVWRDALARSGVRGVIVEVFQL